MDRKKSTSATRPGAKNKARIPKLRRQKRPQGQDMAFVELNGSRIYCGVWNSPEADEAYRAALAEWAARGRQAPTPRNDALIVECVQAYKRYLETYYRDSPQTLARAKYAFKHLLKMYGRLPAAEFTGVHLRAVRECLLNDKLARNTINERVRLVVNMLKHCASLEMIPPEPYQKAATLEPLKRGRSAAKERPPVKPVDQKHVDSVLERVNKSVGALIQLQLLTGCRPGELLQLKREDIDCSGKVWILELATHKTAWRGKRRIIYFGTQAQSILKEFFLKRKPGEYLFQPMDTYRERSEDGNDHRRPSQKPNQRKTNRTINECYSVQAYGKAVMHGCDAAGIPRWTPNQLRHLAASELRKQYGIEITRAVLGHSCLSTSEIYAEVDQGVVMKIMTERG